MWPFLIAISLVGGALYALDKTLHSVVGTWSNGLGILRLNSNGTYSGTFTNTLTPIGAQLSGGKWSVVKDVLVLVTDSGLTLNFRFVVDAQKLTLIDGSGNGTTFLRS